MHARYVLACLGIAMALGIPPAVSSAADPLPRSVLILDQSGRESAWFEPFFAAFRSALGAKLAAHVSVYAEHLDLIRFGGGAARRAHPHISAPEVQRAADRRPGRSHRTVEQHRSRLLEKLGVSSITELVRLTFDRPTE